jgi:hypothetical protein
MPKTLNTALHLVGSEIVRAFNDQLEGNAEEAVERLKNIRADIERFLNATNQRAPRQDLTPYWSPPEGRPLQYQTVLEWLSINATNELLAMSDVAHDTLGLGLQCTRLAKKWNAKLHKVEAPPVLQADEISMVNAYPVAVLEEVLGQMYH